MYPAFRLILCAAASAYTLREVICLKQRTAALSLTAALLCGMLLLTQTAVQTAAVLAERLAYCLQTLIPSLFGCTVLAELLQSTGCMQAEGGCLRQFAERCGLPPQILPVFLLSQIAGYPVGAGLLARETAAGTLRRESAVRLSYVCFGGGPAFLVGFAGARLFGCAAAGWVMLSAAVLSNLLLFLVMPIPPHHIVHSVQPVRLDAETVSGAVSRTVQSMTAICGTVLLFGMLLHIADTLHLFGILSRVLHLPVQTVSAVCSAAADITQLPGLFHIGLPFRVLLPLCAGMLSFGGCCAQMQACALGAAGLRFQRLAVMRIPAALMTALLTAAAAPLIPLPESLPVFAPQAAVSQSGSVLPGLMILFTGLLAAGTVSAREQPS